MKNISRWVGVAAALVLISSVASCRNAEGRLRPPDPLGRAIFDALDRGPREPVYTGVSDEEFLQRSQSPGPGYVWVDGAYGVDEQGRRVCVPGRWIRP